jgi:hypothetical protein
VIRIEHYFYLFNLCVLVDCCHPYIFIMSFILSSFHTCSYVHHVISSLMHIWYSSCAYACNRWGQETQPPEAGGSEEDLLECLNRKPSFFVNGKPRSIKSPNFWNAIKYYVIYIVALSYRCWMKTLAVLISNPCPDIPWILCSSGSSRCLALL